MEFTKENDPAAPSSGSPIRTEADEAEIAARIAAALEEEPAADPEASLSPVFKELREPRLPALPRENRARLLMQTPTRLHFYWSMKNNPFQVLRRAFGDDRGSYTLVVKLVNISRDTEEIHAVDAEGNWWFSVDPDTSYRAEIGFWAPNRPYFRALYSNTVTTPRRSPSPRAASDADWIVTADKFARVLDASGFKQDAVEVALAGDDRAASTEATRSAFAEFIGDAAVEGFTAEELRYALLLIASGETLASLRWKISASLFALLQANAERVAAEPAIAALRGHFEFDDDEFVEEVQLSAVHGASLVHFPRTLRRLKDSAPRYAPVSSGRAKR